MSDKIIVAWICAFSNEQIRTKLVLRMGRFSRFVRGAMHKHIYINKTDFAVWNTNAIREFEKNDEVELHVISPCSHLKNRFQEFDLNGIHYHFFRDESNQLLNSIYRQVVKPSFYQYKQNRRIVSRFIKKVKPTIVHMIGAENPQYSIALLDIPSSIPTIVQLQTLMNDPIFKDNYPINEATYRYRSAIERYVLQQTDYIGTRVTKYISIIREIIKPNASFINTTLAVGESVNNETCDKYYDYVYFANSIDKAGDLVLEAFGLAYQKNASITLDVIGSYSDEFKKQLDKIIDKYGIADAVTFEGRLDTHNDVLTQIRKARIALLPLKIDIISGTIREAMSNGLPVITTDTGEQGTQVLNKNYPCALISPSMDCQSLANNMIELLNNPKLVELLRENAYRRIKELYDNEKVVQEYINAYKKILQGRIV